MADLLRDFVPLVKLSENLPSTYERVRQLVHEGAIPTERDGNGRLFVRRDFAISLAEVRPNHNSLTDAIDSIAMPDSTSDDDLSTTAAELAKRFDVSERRVRNAARTAQDVACVDGFIDADSGGLERIKTALSNQFA